jgi:hypothetical protein
VKEFPVHPAAATLPLLADDELDALAADIRENGQREPITVLVEGDGNKLLLDGRNRLEACRRAGVEPLLNEVTIAEVGSDPTAFVITKNVYRRHLIKYQIAMVLAMLYPEAPPGRSAASRSANELRISGEYVRQARAVLRADRSLAERVLRAEIPLGQAFASISAANAVAPSASDAAPAAPATTVNEPEPSPVAARPKRTRPRDRSGTPPAARSQPRERDVTPEHERIGRQVREAMKRQRADASSPAATAPCSVCGKVVVTG